MATFNKFESFVEKLAHNAVKLDTHQIMFALTNTAPNPSAHSVLSDLTQINYDNLDGNRNITTTSSGQSDGVYALFLTNKEFAANGELGPFRYIVLYDSEGADSPLIGFYDYGSAVTMQDGDTFTIEFDQVDGAITIE